MIVASTANLYEMLRPGYEMLENVFRPHVKTIESISNPKEIQHHPDKFNTGIKIRQQPAMQISLLSSRKPKKKKELPVWASVMFTSFFLLTLYAALAGIGHIFRPNVHLAACSTPPSHFNSFWFNALRLCPRRCQMLLSFKHFKLLNSYFSSMRSLAFIDK